MDSKKAITLLMMEDIVRGLDYISAGNELAEQIVDYLDDGNVAKAYSLLRAIDPRYWHGPAQKKAAETKHFSEVLARIIEEFGVFLDVFKSQGYSA